MMLKRANMKPPFDSKASQRGLAALTVVMLLMLGATLGVVYLNRSVIFEQKIAANHLRAKVALEMADAGIDWATGMLNATQKINTSCSRSTDATAKSFRNTYVTTAFYGTSSPMQPAANTLPGCKIALVPATPFDPANPQYEDPFNCSCPEVSTTETTLPSFGNAASTPNPGFTVQFSPLSADQDPTGTAVRVISTGCAAQTGACDPLAKGQGDAIATAAVVLKLNPSLMYKPTVPLTCGIACLLLNLDQTLKANPLVKTLLGLVTGLLPVVGDLLNLDVADDGKPLRVVNQDPATGGVLVNAGLLSIPGTSNLLALNTLNTTLQAVQELTNTLLGVNLLPEMITLPGKSINHVTAAPDYKLLEEGLKGTLKIPPGQTLGGMLGGILGDVLGGVLKTLTDVLSFKNTDVNVLQCTESSGVFQMYFGTDIATYRDPLKTPTTKVMPSEGSAVATGAQIKAAYDEGWRSFYFPNGAVINSSSGLPAEGLGTESDPVVVVSNKNLEILDGVTVNGFVYLNSAVSASVGLSSYNIKGALVSCGIYVNTGSGDIAYSATALNRAGLIGDIVRVPGSWTDRCTLQSPLPKKPADSIRATNCPGYKDPS